MSPDSHILIDGYNVIFCSDESIRRSPKVVIEQKKEALIRSTGDLCNASAMQVSLVFDGRGASSTIEHPYKDETFTVVHSSAQSSADALLERMLERSEKADKMVLVSNDRLIQSAALAAGASTMSVEAFNDFVSGHIRSRKRSRNSSSGNSRGFNTIPL